ncbi:MAG: hypothetical protein JWL59_2778 [Chthoniobacteraceae bacterium]|nr:hypothetical protein [Chthoniobacteraceae bacterium]
MKNRPSFIPALHTTTKSEADSAEIHPVAASYIVTFLKPEMLHVYRQIKALREFCPVILTQKRENAAAFPFENVRIVRKPITHPLRRIWQKQIFGRPITIYRSEARRLLKELRRIKARVLHVYFGHIGVHLIPLLEICGLPVVVSFHGADGQVGLEKPIHLERTRRMIELATLLLVRSESLAGRLVAIGCPREKIRLHRTGLPLDTIHFQQRTIPEDGQWECLQACRLIEKKGLKTSLRAFAAFLKIYPRARLTIAGEGPRKDALLSLAAELGITEKVSFTGFLSQKELGKLFTKSHLFLHPSELGPDGDQEGVPNSMLEAMANGIPVLATLHGGIQEAVEHGVSGLLVAEGDDAALALAMSALAADPARYFSMSTAAAQRVEAEFNIDVQARTLEKIYREAIAMAS